MDYEKLLNKWSMQTPQVTTLGTVSMYHLELFAKFLAAQQARALDLPYFCGECGNRISMPHHPRCSHFEAAIQ